MTNDRFVSPYAAGFRGKCPRCGDGALFKGFLGLQPDCASCGLDFAKADSGDGPAVFVIFIVGFVTVAAAFIARFVWLTPLWLAFVISAGLGVGLTLLLLRNTRSLKLSFEICLTETSSECLRLEGSTCGSEPALSE